MQLKIVTSGNIYSLQPQYVLQTLYLQTKIESPSTRCGILDKKRLSFKIIALQIQRMIKLLNISKSLPRQTLHNTVFGCVHVFFFFSRKRERRVIVYSRMYAFVCVLCKQPLKHNRTRRSGTSGSSAACRCGLDTETWFCLFPSSPEVTRKRPVEVNLFLTAIYDHLDPNPQMHPQRWPTS